MSLHIDDEDGGKWVVKLTALRNGPATLRHGGGCCVFGEGRDRATGDA